MYAFWNSESNPSLLWLRNNFKLGMALWHVFKLNWIMKLWKSLQNPVKISASYAVKYDWVCIMWSCNRSTDQSAHPQILMKRGWCWVCQESQTWVCSLLFVLKHEFLWVELLLFCFLSVGFNEQGCILFFLFMGIPLCALFVCILARICMLELQLWMPRNLGGKSL